jgi:signal transduction histidine kinase
MLRGNAGFAVAPRSSADCIGELHQSDMKRKPTGLSQRYEATLRQNLKAGAGASLLPALRLGRQAAAQGMETLGLARMHEQALVALALRKGPRGLLKQAETFFIEALAPIVATHRAAQQHQVDLRRLNGALDRRTLELAATNRQLRRDIGRRKSAEAALKKNGGHYTKLLQDSLRLQESLKELTQRVLTTQEVERLKISHELQDEIAQTLLGINVRLDTLKQESRNKSRRLKNDIASAEQLIVRSAQSVRQFAHKLDPSQPGSGNRSPATRRG